MSQKTRDASQSGRPAACMSMAPSSRRAQWRSSDLHSGHVPSGSADRRLAGYQSNLRTTNSCSIIVGMLGEREFKPGGEHDMCVACPSLGDQAEALLAATSVGEMNAAATRLRLTAAGVGRMLTRPLSMNTSLQFDPSVADPEQRRTELADLAVDVVTAVDYLLSLLDTSTAVSSPLSLVYEDRRDSGCSMFDEATFDRLTRRRLDARGTAVRLGMRLLGRLGCDVAYQSQDSAAISIGSSQCPVACLFNKLPLKLSLRFLISCRRGFCPRYPGRSSH